MDYTFATSRQWVSQTTEYSDFFGCFGRDGYGKPPMKVSTEMAVEIVVDFS